jgi:hypothetical protein
MTCVDLGSVYLDIENKLLSYVTGVADESFFSESKFDGAIEFVKVA